MSAGGDGKPNLEAVGANDTAKVGQHTSGGDSTPKAGPTSQPQDPIVALAGATAAGPLALGALPGREATGLWRAACARWALILAAGGNLGVNWMAPSPHVRWEWLGVVVLSLVFLNTLQMVCARMGVLFSPSLSVAIDLAAITGLWHLTGEAQSRWFLGYFWCIPTAVVCFDHAATLLAAFGSAVLYMLYLLGGASVILTPGVAGVAVCMVLLGVWGMAFKEVIVRLGHTDSKANGHEPLQQVKTA